jgi:hypothetical protein
MDMTVLAEDRFISLSREAMFAEGGVVPFTKPGSTQSSIQWLALFAANHWGEATSVTAQVSPSVKTDNLRSVGTGFECHDIPLKWVTATSLTVHLAHRCSFSYLMLNN